MFKMILGIIPTGHGHGLSAVRATIGIGALAIMILGGVQAGAGVQVGAGTAYGGTTHGAQAGAGEAQDTGARHFLVRHGAEDGVLRQVQDLQALIVRPTQEIPVAEIQTWVHARQEATAPVLAIQDLATVRKAIYLHVLATAEWALMPILVQLNR